MRKAMYLMVSALLMTLACGDGQIKQTSDKSSIARNENIVQLEEIDNSYLRRKTETSYLYELYFSNLIYKGKNEEFKFPIFQGYKKDVYYNDFVKYCILNKLLPERVNPNFYIDFKRGEYKKTLHKFLDFYKEKMSQYFDITKPTGADYALPEVDFYYEFKAGDVDCFFAFTIELDEKDNSDGSSPYDVIPDENSYFKAIAYSFDYKYYDPTIYSIK